MLKTDAKFGVAERQRCLGIRMLAQGKYFRSHQTEKYRKVDKSDCENHVNRSGASHRSPICSLEITGDNTKRCADRKRESGSNNGDKHVSARSCDEPRQDIDA